MNPLLGRFNRELHPSSLLAQAHLTSTQTMAVAQDVRFVDYISLYYRTERIMWTLSGKTIQHDQRKSVCCWPPCLASSLGGVATCSWPLRHRQCCSQLNAQPRVTASSQSRRSRWLWEVLMLSNLKECAQYETRLLAMDLRKNIAASVVKQMSVPNSCRTRKHFH